MFFQWVSVTTLSTHTTLTSVSFAAKMMDLKESSLSATFSAGSCAAVANLEPNQRQNVSNSNANQLNTSTATPVISLFKLKNFLYQPKFKSLMTSDGKAFPSGYHFDYHLITIWLPFNYNLIIFSYLCLLLIKTIRTFIDYHTIIGLLLSLCVFNSSEFRALTLTTNSRRGSVWIWRFGLIAITPQLVCKSYQCWQSSDK